MRLQKTFQNHHRWPSGSIMTIRFANFSETILVVWPTTHFRRSPSRGEEASVGAVDVPPGCERPPMMSEKPLVCFEASPAPSGGATGSTVRRREMATQLSKSHATTNRREERGWWPRGRTTTTRMMADRTTTWWAAAARAAATQRTARRVLQQRVGDDDDHWPTKSRSVAPQAMSARTTAG